MKQFLSRLFRRPKKKMRYPNGIPRTDEWNRNVVSFLVVDPLWRVHADGSRVMELPDGSQITYGGSR
ncbi:hypothetical protein MycrhDRAFT_5788 [Mycolicibacterium rhodesiae JS60]|nr:hypothetical protein MycrhDRAFT_5788 [Mycolicibacterium rhodesiae JS60]